MDFLNHLPKTVPGETILASFDVESLYSNIPQDLGDKICTSLRYPCNRLFRGGVIFANQRKLWQTLPKIFYKILE